jgi:hypothetical protein
MRRRTLISGLCVLVAFGCGGKKLPTAPDDLTEGIVVFEDRDFKGRSAHITSDIADLESFTGPCVKTSSDAYGGSSSSYSWDNCISSVRVAPGWRATLYGDSHYKGSTLEVSSDVADLRSVSGRCEDGLNDCISSIRVSR